MNIASRIEGLANSYGTGIHVELRCCDGVMEQYCDAEMIVMACDGVLLML